MQAANSGATGGSGAALQSEAGGFFHLLVHARVHRGRRGADWRHCQRVAKGGGGLVVVMQSGDHGGGSIRADRIGMNLNECVGCGFNIEWPFHGPLDIDDFAILVAGLQLEDAAAACRHGAVAGQAACRGLILRRVGCRVGIVTAATTATSGQQCCQ